MGLSSLLTKIFKKKVKRFGPSLISLDSNPVPVGLFKTFTAGASITANQVVSLYTDGKVYPSSPSYPNIVGIAIDSAGAGGSVRVIVVGVAQAVSDGAISQGDLLTYSSSTAGRVVRYTGHSHGASTATGTAVTDISYATGTFVTGVSTSTGSFVSNISIDRRDFTTTTVLSDISTSTCSVVTNIGSDTGYYTDAYNYIRHYHSTNTVNAVIDLSKSTATVVTGITTTSGTTVVANVTSTSGSAVTGVSTSTGSAVTSVSKSTDTFLKSVSVSSSLSRVLGIALTSTTAAGQNLTVLVLPSWV